MDFNPIARRRGRGRWLVQRSDRPDLAGLHDGDNLVELQGEGTWTGTYRIAVTGVDLVLED